jgi:hypothetical protein
MLPYYKSEKNIIFGSKMKIKVHVFTVNKYKEIIGILQVFYQLPGNPLASMVNLPIVGNLPIMAKGFPIVAKGFPGRG